MTSERAKKIIRDKMMENNISIGKIQFQGIEKTGSGLTIRKAILSLENPTGVGVDFFIGYLNDIEGEYGICIATKLLEL